MLDERADDRVNADRARSAEVLVLGAGIAGLSAARALADRGVSAIVLEARDRVGGRICTAHPDDADPVELGAEFVHGDPAALLTLADDARARLVRVPDAHWFRSGDGFRFEGGLDDRVERFLSATRSLPRDATIAEALAGWPAEEADVVRNLVEGFHAAPADRYPIGGLESGTAAGWTVLGGYDRLVARLATGADVRLGVAASAVRWRPGRVEVETSAGRFEAERVIVALPLGVLRSGAVAFDPPLPAAHAAALAHLAPGDVVRVVLELGADRWDALPWDAERPPRFVHGTGVFPTFWTTYPVRSPRWTAWVGGSRAVGLRDVPPTDRVDRAVAALAQALGVGEDRLRDGLRGGWTHDWVADPWSRGAYTHFLPGGLDAPERLQAGIADTIWLAGEHTDPNVGTVDGALASGRRAAEAAVRAQGDRRAR